MTMIKLEPEERSPRGGRASSQPAAPSEVKLLLVTFRSGEAVRQHPELQPWIEAGWSVRSAVPRVVESGDTKLLVILERPAFAAETLSPSMPSRESA